VEQLSSAAVPPTVRAGLTPAMDLASAQAFTRQLTHTHYENFSVVSRFVPSHLRQDFCNVYAFCRIADDAGDETGDAELSLRLLQDMRDQTAACFAGESASTLFVALADTAHRQKLPIQPFLDLIDAFEQDQQVHRYQAYDQLLDYCRRSANPVGRLVLHLFGYHDPERHHLSDQICTALQLTNFWQDVRRDIRERGRIYIPQEDMDRHGISPDFIDRGICDDKYRELIRFEVDRTETLFASGDALPPMLEPIHQRQIALFSRGGRAILQAIRDQNYNTLTHRPALSRWTKWRLALGLMLSWRGAA
jgi:squalene synthase HpnC